jgi:UDP:flavonoid glycosyltransferase YjiC (YdhE family)
VVVWPMFADQFANARTVAEAGAGVAVHARPGCDGGADRVDGVAAREITTAIETVRRDPSYRHRARGIEAEMGAAPTAADVLRDLVVPREGRGLPGPAR